MITLENILKTAQREANRERRAMTVWNLNRYSPLYVVRLACEGDATRKGPGTFVATVQPEARDALTETQARELAKHDRHYVARQNKTGEWIVWDSVSDHRVEFDRQP